MNTIVGYVTCAGVLVSLFVLFDIRRRTTSATGRSRRATFRDSVIDTSALIDGRIVHLIEQSWLSGDIVIPKVVLNELQHIADGKNAHKRSRARAGLETAAQLQTLQGSTVVIDRSYDGDQSVATDEALVRIARQRHARLVTNDYNLQQVAASESVLVLNTNELAEHLKIPVTPGDILKIHILKAGEERGQGIGYMDDGTMVVVQGAARQVGSRVQVVIDSSRQSRTGRMVFASKK